MTMSTRHSWNSGQVNVFAKRFAQSESARAWGFLVPAVREALIRAFALDIALGNDRESVTVREAQELANDIALGGGHAAPPTDILCRSMSACAMSLASSC